MRRFSLILLVVLACPAFARASLVEFNYSYTIGPLSFSAYGGGPISLSSSTNPDGGFTVDHGSGTITFALAPAGTGSAVAGDPSSPGVIPLGGLSAGTTPNGSAGAFAYQAYFDVAVQLTDAASGQSATLPLYGSVAANAGAAGSGGAIGLTAGFWIGVTLGDHFYFLMANPEYLEVASDAPPAPLSLQVFVDTDPTPPFPVPVGDPVTGPQQVPEPSSLLLGGGCLGLLAVARLRRRR